LTRTRRGLALLGAAVVLAAASDGCSMVLGIDGEYADQTEAGVTPPRPDAANDARDATNDGGGDASDARDTGIVDAVSDVRVPCATPDGACVAAIPADWELVLFARNRDSGCPVNFTATDRIANPTAGAGACDCSCSVSSGATCTRGRLSTKYDTSNACGNTGAGLDVDGDDCTSINSSLSDWFSATPLAATNVACSASTVTNEELVDSTPMRECSVPDSCREEICNGDVPAGYDACLTREGSADCPAGWVSRTVVGDGAELLCSSCTCTGAADCTGARITFFGDNRCSSGAKGFDVNDACQDTNGGGRISGFTYTATVSNARCTSAGPKTGVVTLTGTRTVCCK
jgi:hypothetical protein